MPFFLCEERFVLISEIEMKGHVFAQGDKDIKPVRHIRQVYEFFKTRSDPRKVDENLIFSVGEDDCHLVFFCQATVGSHYYFALTFKHIAGEREEETRFWFSHKTLWDKNRLIQNRYDEELSWSLPEGFIHSPKGYWKYVAGSFEEGVALLKVYGFKYSDDMEETLCEEDF